MKVVINTCFGGFGLSPQAIERYVALGGILVDGQFWSFEVKRNDPALVQTVEELGDAANDRYSKLKVVEIPDDVVWYIHNYDGQEQVYEAHRTWS